MKQRWSRPRVSYSVSLETPYVCYMCVSYETLLRYRRREERLSKRVQRESYNAESHLESRITRYLRAGFVHENSQTRENKARG